MSSCPNLREFAGGASTDSGPTRDEDLDLRLAREFSWSSPGERRDLRDTEGDLSLDQNSVPLSREAEAAADLEEVERDLEETLKNIPVTL